MIKVQACLAVSSLSAFAWTWPSQPWTAARTWPSQPWNPTWPTQPWIGDSNFRLPPQSLSVVDPHQIKREMASFICQIKRHSFIKKKVQGKSLTLGKRSFWGSWRLGPWKGRILRWDGKDVIFGNANVSEDIFKGIL